MADQNTPIDLYQLLPAFYRIDDAKQGYPLRALMDLVSRQAELLRQDISGLWDDFFIETCAQWVIPYIGDLVSNRALNPVVRGSRADVAKTIYYRRRKGTLPMLEELARDVTGWGAHAVAFFQMLGWTQNLNHLRLQAAPNPSLRNPTAWDRVGTVHIRNLDAMDRLNGPFDITTHTVDVRPVSTLEGWYNIRNIGFFLWRLTSYPVDHSDPRPSPVAVNYGYHFSPLGNRTPLFTLPDTMLAANALADEFHVPGPIRRMAFDEDLNAYKSQAAAAGYVNLPATSRFFGPGKSLTIYRGGASVSPLDVVCADLSNWDRPPSAFSGLFSGNLAAFAGLSAAAPQLNVTIGSEGPHVAAIGGSPTTRPAAALALQQAIRAASANPGFAGARVMVVGSQLLVIPGTRGAAIVFAATGADATTVHELALDAASAQTVDGILSGDLTDFPTLVAPAPQVSVTIAGDGPHVAAFAAPANLADAAVKLAAAIQGAAATPAFTGAQVLVLENRLLVLPGIMGQPIVIRRNAGDPATAEQLKLSPKIGVDVVLGRFAFAIGDEPANAPEVRYTYGFSDNIGGGPYDRRRPPQTLGQPAPAVPDTVANPQALGLLLEVSPTLPPSPTNFHTIGAAIAAWVAAANPATVIQIDDSRSYPEVLNINLPAGSQLTIQAKNLERPTLLGDITANAAGGSARFRVDGLWIEGQMHIQGDLGELRLAHATLVPGIRLDEQGVPKVPDTPSLIVDQSDTNLTCQIDHCISGSLMIPEAAGQIALSVNDSIIDTSRAQGRATSVPAWISGGLSVFPALSSPSPVLLATIGDIGPIKLSLPKPIPDLPTAAAKLQAALQGAAPQEGFAGARVLLAENRLVVIPGVNRTAFLESQPGDNTAVELKLDAGNARSVTGLRSGPLPAVLHLTAAAPKLNVVVDGSLSDGTTGAFGPDVVSLAPVPVDVASARTSLENGIRAAAATPEFTEAMVLADGQTLLVFPGGNHVGIVFLTGDPTTLLEMQLESVRPSLAATLSGATPGPNTSLSRVTIFGPVHVRELVMATEVIFVSRVMADRRQAGCVRFSYLAPYSRTPARYRCQPDLALEGVTDPAQKALIRARIQPSFTSIHYGDPGYAQLSLNCPCEIRTGAENGSEMGAFSELMQPQREGNLRIRLSEYLPFGLDAGLIYVT